MMNKDNDGDEDSKQMRKVDFRNAAQSLVERNSFMEESVKFKRRLEGLLLPFEKMQKDFSGT
jgi:hypothetical protein